MWCAHCGQEMTCQPGTHRYEESGLKNILLINIPIWKCNHCGETAVEIPGMEELHKLLAIIVVLKPTGLQKEEIRFLRKHLGYSQDELAEKLGVTRVTVTRWEEGQTFQKSNDKALRRLYVEKKGEELRQSAVMKFLSPLVDGLPVKSKKIERRIRLEDWMTSGSQHDCLEPVG